MKTLRRLILLNTALLVLFGFGIAIFFPQVFPVESAAARPYQEMATLRFLGVGLGALALVVMMAASGLSLIGNRRELAFWLSAADILIGLTAFTQQSAIWESRLGWFLVLVPFGLAALLIWAGLQPLKPAEIAAEVAGLQIPGEMREALLRQVGEAAAQEERNRLARDLHDSIKQQLFSINVGTATAQERWERDPDGARTALVDVRRSAREAMVEMQALLQQLRPRALGSTSGLVEALREQCEALGYRSGAQVTVELGPEFPDDRMPPGSYEALFRIAQEALANVARHARARHVHLWLGHERDSALLRVADDGQGFDPKAVNPGMGLRNLRERAQSLDGTIHIAAQPGAGATIAVRIPLIAAPQRQESRIQTLISQERLHPFSWLLLVFLFFKDTGKNPMVHPLREMPIDLLLVFALPAIAFWVWWRVRSAVKANPGADPAAVRELLYLGSRSRILFILLAIWWALWLWGLTPVEWIGVRITWAAVMVLCLGITAVELVLFHRRTRFRRSFPKIRWMPLTAWSAHARSSAFLTLLTIAMAISNPLHLSKMAPPQLLFLYAGGATLAYIFSRQARMEGASR